VSEMWHVSGVVIAWGHWVSSCRVLGETFSPMSSPDSCNFRRHASMGHGTTADRTRSASRWPHTLRTPTPA